MLVSKACCEETAKEIIWEFESLLCNNDIKLNNLDPTQNEFESEESYINKADYEKLVKEITKQLLDFSDFVEEKTREYVA